MAIYKNLFIDKKSNILHFYTYVTLKILAPSKYKDLV